jgi:ABC-type sugar transport system substrate-binding protein
MIRSRYIPAAALAVSLALFTSACGTNDNSGGGSESATSRADVEQAQTVVDTATTGLVSVPSIDYLDAAKFTAVSSWPGTTEPVKITPGKKIIAISCGATSCNDTANQIVDVAKSAGWQGEAANISGASDTASLNSIFASSIAKKPDVIVGIALPSEVVGSSLAEARDAGILTVSIADTAPTGGAKQYDAAVRLPNSGKMQLIAYQVIADSKGRGNALVIDSTDFSDIHKSAQNFVKTMGTCSGCSVATIPWLITDAIDPTKVNSKIAAALNSNPKATALAVPYTVGLPAVIAAVKASGRNIDIYVSDLDEVSSPALKSGDIKSVTAFSFSLAGYLAVDAALRSLMKAPPVPLDQTPLLLHIYDKSNLPTNGKDNFAKYLDYASNYSKLWEK